METDEILDLLAEVADEVEREENSCSLCRAHDEHDVCERPDIAAAIRRVVEKKRKEHKQ